MALTISRIDRVYRDYEVSTTLRDGTAATPSGVDIALLPPGNTPNGTTTWTATTYSAGVATVLYAGPDASPSGALVVPAGGADVYLRVSDTPEVDAEKVERINVR